MSFTLINASAGSGKTYTLTRLLAQRLAAGLDPSQVIATTFTVKAADELSQRVRSTLLDRQQVEAARGIDSALISTVNSVAGRLVTEYALDAGISPQVQVLDDTTQKAAFAAAIDRTAAAAGVRWAAMLARTEHDGDEKDTGVGFGNRKQAWRGRVKDVADTARTNLLGAEDLRAAAPASWEEFRAAAQLPEPGDDLRGRWLHELGQRIGDFELDLAASVDAAGEAVKGGPIAARSVNRARGDLTALRRLERTLRDHDRAPWSSWLRLARGAFGAPANAALEPLAVEIAESFAENPAWQQDLQDLIALVLDVAAESLEAYETYKRELGLIDFIDQEVRALRLLQGSPRVRQSIASRFRLLAVDEFQDTSPIQLALFLELSQLIEEKIWVGDPKQAIYGFRDADPRLMRDIIAALEGGGTVFGTGEVQNLSHSWRSQKLLVDFSNAVFAPVFAPEGTGLERVALSIPAQRQAAAGGGRLEVWEATKNDRRVVSAQKHAAMIAEQIRRRIDEGAFTPGGTAVLVRSNAQRASVVAALQERGVPTAGAAHPLLATREAQMVRAALAVTLDGSDTLALTELVTLLEDHGAHRDWFAQLMAAPDRDARREVFAQWWEDPVLSGLREVRRACIGFTPVEMVSALIDALDLPQRIKRWTDQGSRRRTLDALRALARDTTERRRAEGSPITLTGLRSELDAWEEGPDLSALPDAVWVGTIHGAKGLEWDHVVTYLGAPPKERDHSSGVLVVSPGALDVTAPLAGRSLRFWPKVAAAVEITEHLAVSDFATRRRSAEAEESGRLHYVALTRAARTAVLAVPGAATVLDTLVERTPLVSWSDEALTVHGTSDPLPATIARVNVDELLEGTPQRLPRPADPLAATDVPLRPSGEAARRVSARFQASAVGSDDGLGEVREPRSIGPVLVSGGGPQWERVGEAVHAYLALPLTHLDPVRRREAAQRLLERWMVTRTVDAQVLLDAGERWNAFLTAEFPGAVTMAEQPITWWNEDSQVMEGWIDTLLRLPDGSVVLVDHKTYPGDDPVRHVRENYLGQMSTYSRALAAAGSRPQRILLHLPLRGEVLEVRLPEHGR
ncbi:exodeoxyribonuclease V subunit beta [Brachybacterium sp. FME24]|uniref:UvrD-helicase domain-containing protein n=1 Tax=Brachybacterium sp. FME24 TaxID=2742605 RepID=UPI0018678762|nr:UvrD-helicase domain-containing protein [Brachybacterium sp. FME24]